MPAPVPKRNDWNLSGGPVLEGTKQPRAGGCTDRNCVWECSRAKTSADREASRTGGCRSAQDTGGVPQTSSTQQLCKVSQDRKPGEQVGVWAVMPAFRMLR